MDDLRIVKIQSYWRGHLARNRVYADLDETRTPETSIMLRKRLMPPPRAPQQDTNEHISAKLEPVVTEILPTEVPRVHEEKIPFDKSYEVVVMIDGAVGLPLTTTATRIHTTLFMPTKQQIHESSVTSFSDLQSEYTNPHFSIRVRWKGKMLHPTMTIVCKIDTLEAPHLEPRCIGYTAIRLCVDTIGMQPLSEVLYDGRPSCFFNVGQFLVPVLYGQLSNDLEFMTEAKLQEALPHIDGAFLRMGILALKPGEAIPEQPFSAMKIDANVRPAMLSIQTPSNTDEKELSSMIDPLSLTSKSVASMVLKTYITTGIDAGNTALRINVNEDTIQRFQRGEKLEMMEKQNFISTIYDFVQKSFQEVKEVRESISPRYLLEYSDAYGAMASLDMLYNMPERKKLIQAAEKAGAVAAMRRGLQRDYDNKINTFKTVFRYLPGALPTPAHDHKDNANFILSNPVSPRGSVSNANAPVPASSSVTHHNSINTPSHYGGKLKSPKSFQPYGKNDFHESIEALAVKQDMTQNSLIVDDASVKLAFDSTERCPEYLDDFSSTAGMKLGPHACLLVVVTAVDVLTSKRPPPSKYSSNDKLETNSLSSAQDKVSVGGVPLSPMNSKSSINIDEAFASSKSFTQRQNKLKGLLGIYVGNNDPRATWWGILPLFAKFPTPAVIANHTNAVESPSSPGKMVNVQLIASSMAQDFAQMTSTGTEVLVGHPNQSGGPMAKGVVDVDATAMLTSLASSPVFVNEGAHQVPLFQGTPPLEMISSPDPFAWVISRLNYQISKNIRKQSQLSFYMSRILLSPLILCLPSHGAVIHMSSGNHHHNGSSGVLSAGSSSAAMSSIASGKESDFMSSVSEKNVSYHSNGTTSYKNNGSSSSKKDKKRKKKKYEDILLSTGCSAFIRMIDPRVKRLAGPPVSLCGLTGNAGNSMTGNNNSKPGNGMPGSPYQGTNNMAANGSPSVHHHRDSLTNAANSNNSTNNVAIRSFQQDTLYDFLYLMSHFAQEDHEHMSLHFDTTKFKNLRHEFQFKAADKKKLGGSGGNNSANNASNSNGNNSNNSSGGSNSNTTTNNAPSLLQRAVENIGGGVAGRARTYRHAIPDTIEKETLMQEINNKFYDVLSS